MPKSYELKLREAEERRRPKPKQEIYKAIEGVPQKVLVGYDHPETLQLEMQLSWAQDTYTIHELHEHLMAEVLRLDAEYKRRALRLNYSQKYLWFDRFVMRPRIKDRELLLQDYGFKTGWRVRLTPAYSYEKMWGSPNPYIPEHERPANQMGPQEDKDLLRRLDSGPPTARVRLFLFPWLGGSTNAYRPVLEKLPKDWGVYAIELPNHAERKDEDEGYPTGQFQCEVMALTLAKEMKKPGSNLFFAHSQGTHFAYYTAKFLKRDHNIAPKCFFISNFFVPAASPLMDVSTLRARENLCVPLRIFVGLIKGGWGCNPKLGYKSGMGFCSYQHEDMWPFARTIIYDHWSTKEFPLPGADERLSCPIFAFYGKDDRAVSYDMVLEWRGLSSAPEKFECKQMDGGHLWFSDSTKHAEALAKELSAAAKRFL